MKGGKQQSCGGLDMLKLERMEGERLVKKIYRAEVEGNRGEVDQGKDGWME